MIIVCHMDDLKLSHVDENEVTKVIKELEEMYGKMITIRG